MIEMENKKQIGNGDKNMKEICKKAIEKWGTTKQLNMIIEECSELIKAISKYQRYKHKHNEEWRLKAVEEIVDVQIMIEQGKLMLTTEEEFEQIRYEKLARLKTLIESDAEQWGD